MISKGSILVIDDNKAIISALELLLPKYFKNVKFSLTPNIIPHELSKEHYDVVLLDMNFCAGINSGNEGLFWLGEIKKISPVAEVVLFTAYADIDLAINTIKKGAFDFISKPWDNAKLISTLSAAVNMSLSRGENKKLKEIKKDSGSQIEMYWGDTQVMTDLKKVLEKVAATDAFILITGENGTGKDVLAQQIHALSSRSNESLISVDIGSLPESLFESELFGYVKGAFTDAKSDRAGKFEIADKGTLFLDEIGNIPLHLQSKLLRAIQSKSIVRLGSNKSTEIDIRLICATNKNLQDMVARDDFREDLLYRINTIHLTIPPLRDRRQDIMPLTEIFIRRFSNKYGKNITSVSPSAREKLEKYRWSGNIRELQHTVEKAVILAEDNILKDSDFLLSAPDLDLPRESKYSTLEDMEEQMIRNALSKYGGNMSQVAQQLGITRQTLYNKLKKYEI